MRGEQQVFGCKSIYSVSAFPPNHSQEWRLPELSLKLRSPAGRNQTLAQRWFDGVFGAVDNWEHYLVAKSNLRWRDHLLAQDPKTEPRES